jgi:membrane protein
VLIGAELTAALPYLRTGGVWLRRVPGAALLDAVRLLRLLHQAHDKGEVPATGELRAALRMPLEDCESLLERLARLGWAVPAAGERWVLGRDVGNITLEQVCREFVFDAQAHARAGGEGFEAAVARLTADAQARLSITLESLFSEPASSRSIGARRLRA